MYEVDDRDRVVELTDVPQSSVGAPLPVVVADERTTQLAYMANLPDPDSTFECVADGFTATVVDGPLALVAIRMVQALL